MRVLVLEDSSVIQKIIACLLKPIGMMDLDMASDLNEALGHIQRRISLGQRHDLVLTDLNCPGHAEHPDTMDRGGLALAGLLRKDARFSRLLDFIGNMAKGYDQVPILMFTSNPNGIGEFDPAPVDQVLYKGEYLKVSNQAKFADLIRQALGAAKTA